MSSAAAAASSRFSVQFSRTAPGGAFANTGARTTNSNHRPLHLTLRNAKVRPSRAHQGLGAGAAW